jgi:hypothetical protein
MRFRAIYFAACDLELTTGFFTEGLSAPVVALLFDLAAAPECLAGACFTGGAALLFRSAGAADFASAPFGNAVIRACVVDGELAA